MNSSKLTYRAEIDGLRAIAVLSVILYHAQLVLFGRDWFEGGYLGVDIFFVISGYLITRIILCELNATGTFNFLNFYERRARRILPMLLVVILMSIPFAWQKLLPSDFVEYAESILASIFFGSNFFFYFSTTEYGADSALLKQMLHTWSLGVEEQFYLLFPIIALITFRFARQHFLTIIVALSLLSLQFSELMGARNSDLNFYLPFSRFWELAVGSMLAYREVNYRPSNDGIGARVLPVVGLYLVLYSILSFDGQTPHPSFFTLLPIAGVALIIAFSSQKELVGKFLGGRYFVGVGLISYSAYLWHFPVFAFSRMEKEPIISEKFELIGLTLFLSSLSYFFIEKPFRNKRLLGQHRFLAIIVSLTTLLSIFSISAVVNEGYSGRNNKASLGSIDFDNQRLRKESWSLLSNRLRENEGFGDARRKVLIVGNSHGKDIFNALFQNNNYFEDTDFLKFPGNAYFQLACLDPAVTEYAEEARSLYDSEAYVDSTTIVVSTFYNRSHRCNVKREDWPTANDFVGLKSLIQRAKSEGKNIILMDQSPKFISPRRDKRPLVDILLGDLSDLEDSFDMSEFKKILSEEMYGAIDWKRHEDVATELTEISQTYNVPVFSKLSVICDLELFRCDGLTGFNEKIFYDQHHYTLAGAKLIGERLAHQGLDKLLK